MMTIDLQEIAKVLRQYQGRYSYLDVLAHHVQELSEQSSAQFIKKGENLFVATLGDEQLDLQLFPEQSVARFALVPSNNTTGGAFVGAAIGALLSKSNKRSQGPNDVILGMLVGGLIGSAVAGTPPIRSNNRIMTLQYNPQTKRWQVYDGPYLQWAKAVLNPG